MSVLLLNDADVKKTWAAIAARISRRPLFQVVPEDAMATIESVILVNEDEAWDRWPTNSDAHRAYRAHFWKQCVLEAVVDFADEDGEDVNVGLWAVYFHEYIAASMRGSAAAAFEVDENVADIRYTRASVGPEIAQRTLRDAYATCAAGLEGYTPEWNS